MKIKPAAHIGCRNAELGVNAVMSNDFVVQAEAKALSGDAAEESKLEPEDQNPLLDELHQAIRMLVQRVDQLEHQVEQETAARQELAEAMQRLEAELAHSAPEPAPIPEPGTFSRIGSYGRKRKKKKRSFLRKLFQ